MTEHEQNEFSMLEPFLKGLTLYRVEFPEFWLRSYEAKDRFFAQISEHAHMFVSLFNENAELLEDERIGRFWHQHCEFCMDRAETDRACVFYCTKDFRRWICESCFEAHKAQFRFAGRTGFFHFEIRGLPEKSRGSAQISQENILIILTNCVIISFPSGGYAK